MIYRKRRIQFHICGILALIICWNAYGQGGNPIKWSKDGNSYYVSKAEEITEVSLPENKETVLFSKEKLIPPGQTKPINIRNFYFSEDRQKVLIYTNTKKVWRYDTRGDYWVFIPGTNSLEQLGKSLPASSLMFAKFSPDGNQVAYSSEHNLYVEDLVSHQ
ncbi:MAG TPA: DPP IV N-terminal domain-containing protein, partial [Puia sp.]|nr:DPP IV N-terminal domain-containing protein [Puia sp.]